MVRFTRGKSSHQRVEADSTSWKELKSTPPKEQGAGFDRKRKSLDNPNPKANGGNNEPSPLADKFKGQNGNNKIHPKKDFKNNNNKPRNQKFHKTQHSTNRNDEGESANFTPLGSAGNVKGYGQTKVVKIFGNVWVGPEDARRLQTLVKKLRAEGLSRKEILDALQGEKRQAEKAAKRRRDKTCFSCRQFGHVLADCPKARGKVDGEGKDESGEAAISNGEICFKCGSTEHTSRFCKRKSDTFQFAKCFICTQSGHIARQCPTNTKGIYPSGGCCDECGSVNHLKKDCPDIVGVDNSIEDDPSAMVSRIADPFASTEYEDIPETSTEIPDDDSQSEEKQEKPKPFKSRMVKGKRKMIVDDVVPDEVQKPARVNSNVSLLKPPQPQKKRKVVKF